MDQPASRLTCQGWSGVDCARERQEDIPTTLADGRYTLGEVLGTGACATVYAASDQLLGVDRAVKVIGATASPRHEQLAERLVLEARAMARLSHPNILRVYDIGEDEGLHYVVMDRADNGSLAQLVDRVGALPPEVALRYTIQVLSALAAAHAQGVIHRDVKPQNILLSKSFAALLADFGIAMLTNEEALRSTRTNVGMGSFAYMAPEQRFDARHVAPSADLYSVASTLYFLLTGASPIDLFAVTDRKSDRWRSVSEELVDILQHALRYDPTERYQDARTMAADLRAALDRVGRSPTAEDPLDPTHFPEPSKRFETDEHRIVMPRREELPGPPALEFEKSLTFLDEPAQPPAYPTLVAPPEGLGDTDLVPPPEQGPQDGAEAEAWSGTEEPSEGRAALWVVAALVMVGVATAALSLRGQAPAEQVVATVEQAVEPVEAPEAVPSRVEELEAPAVDPVAAPPVEPEPLPPQPEPPTVVEVDEPEPEPEPAPVAVAVAEPPFGRWGGSWNGLESHWQLGGSHDHVEGTFTVDNGQGKAATDHVTGTYDPATRELVLHDEVGRYEITLRPDGRGFAGRYVFGQGNVHPVNGWRTDG